MLLIKYLTENKSFKFLNFESKRTWLKKVNLRLKGNYKYLISSFKRQNNLFTLNEFENKISVKKSLFIFNYNKLKLDIKWMDEISKCFLKLEYA